ncbi:MAG: xanthine dehydrogenase family protein molybdopterin-binding subunit, partial [Planctomycetota bacterium]
MSAQEKKLRVGSPLMHRRIAATPDAGDAPPWDLDTRHALVGKRIPRLDALAKVSGRARFPSDVRPGDLLYAAVLRSAIPAGMVKRIELGPALRMPGVEGGVLAKEPGKKIRYQGDELCAVCATSRAAAEEALRKVTLELEPSEHTAERAGEARQKLPEADPLPTSLAEVGEAEGDEVELTHVYETQTQMHHPLEPHGITARVGADSSVDVWASTQATFGMRAGIAKALEIPQEKVRVHTEHMGGGFGSKLSPGVEARLCALLAKQTGKPVQLFVDRRAEALAVGNRPASLQCLKVKASKAGKILEWSGKTIGLTGYAGSGRVTSPVSFYLPGKRARLGHEDLRDNQGSARAFRAPGHPQGFFAAESIVDELAYRVGMDPLEFRLKNLAGTLYTEQLKLAAKEIDWERHSNRSPGRVSGGERSLRGVGMAITTWGIWASRGTQVLCRIHPSGRVEVRNGAQDIGTGSRTVLGIITAETLGIPVERVDVFLGDTKDPVGPGSGGSMT